MVDFHKITTKWQNKWKKANIFEPEINKKKKKFFFTIAYPYISGSLHIGHGRAAVEGDVFARYKRMQGFNVLFPLGFHITGTPVLGISAAIEKGDKKKIELYKGYVKNYVKTEKEADKIVKSFKDPWKIVEFFTPKMMEEYTSIGLGIDWTRRFNTGDKDYQQFITWQFHKYKDKDYLIKGSYPVLYCPGCKNAVGEDDIQDADTDPVEKQEFTLLKFKVKDSDLIVVAASLRPETVYGQTNLWIDPKTTYIKLKVGKETWIVSKPCYEKLAYQKNNLEKKGDIEGKDLIGKYATAPGINRKIIILPSKFTNPEIGTGIVTSVPSDAPYDYIALQDLKKDKALCEKYNLDPKEIEKIKVIPIIKTKKYGDIAAKKIVEDLKIKNQEDKKLEEATKLVYKEGFHNGILLKSCGKYAGKKVEEAKEKMKAELLKKKSADIMYETSREAYCRSGDKIVVSVLNDQWFLDFNAKGWKKLANKCLSKMEIQPNTIRKQFEDTFDWLDKRPCARRRGIGTPLPFNKDWIIESLSDSTIYMTFYTIKNLINKHKVKPTQLTIEFFDYVYLGKGKIENVSKKTKIKKEALKEMRESFEYWYPNDHRHTFLAHLSNHLSFFIFSHAGIFPEKYWPKKISIHGFVISEGHKMSKSKGNVITLLDISKEFSADVFRFYMTTSTTIDETFNWRNHDAENVKKVLGKLYDTLEKGIKNKKEGKLSNKSLAFVSKFERSVMLATEHLEKMELREYGTRVVYGLLSDLKKAQRRLSDKEMPAVYDHVIERWIILLAPVVPHLAEELWSKLGKKDLVSIAPWPKYDKKLINEKAEFISEIIANLISDINEVKILAKVQKPKEITIITAYEWKYKFMKEFKKKQEKTRNIGELIKSLVDKQHGKEISKLIPMLVKNPQRVPEILVSQKEEFEAIKDNLKIIEREFGAKVKLEMAEKSKQPKKNNALPGKPAILITSN